MSHDYYSSKDILPTFANLKNGNHLKKYTDIRERMFFRLKFLPQMFQGKTLLECGPDSGENALVFNKWGAKLTLIEPNVKAHASIKKNFRNFRQPRPKILGESLLDFNHDPFDIVCAEGFVYTIQPSELWIKKIGQLLKPGGFAIVSYLEKHGCGVELLTKEIYERVSAERGPGIETAKLLFLKKWNTISHTRSFESWFMDVIENPFVSPEYLIDYKTLMGQMRKFRLYSSWPTYLSTEQWIKSPLSQSLIEIKEELFTLNTEDLISFCHDSWFMSHWGMPNHYAILQKIP